MRAGDSRAWLSALRRYLVVTSGGHLLWESLHVPLYTIWYEGTATAIAFAVLHCTGGDLLIATSSLALALVLAGSNSWPVERFRAVACLTVAFGLGYTVHSEWLNVTVRGSWAYSPRMPTLPPLGTGVSPALQWIVIPFAALLAARSKGLSRAAEQSAHADPGRDPPVGTRARSEQPAPEYRP
jgi:hypothetical protein